MSYSTGYTDNHYWWYWVGGDVQMGTALTMPSSGGFLDNMGVKFGGYYCNPSCHLVVWTSGLDVLAYSGAFTAGSYGQTNNLPWYITGSGGVPWLNSHPYIPGGTTLYLGVSSDNNAIGTFTESGGNSWYSTDTGHPGALYPRSQIGGVQKNLNVIIYYTVGGVGHVRRSNSWITGPIKVRRSGAWTTGLSRVRRSNSWVVSS